MGLKPRTLDNWRVAGKGPNHYKVGGRVMYRRVEVHAWLEIPRISNREWLLSSACHHTGGAWLHGLWSATLCAFGTLGLLGVVYVDLPTSITILVGATSTYALISSAVVAVGCWEHMVTARRYRRAARSGAF